MSWDTRHPALDRVCSCGHMRRDHADGYSRCDCGECSKYDGPIERINTFLHVSDYGPYGYVGAYTPPDDEIMIYPG